MKKQILLLMLCLFSLISYSQEGNQETTYRRSSLYALMFPDQGLDSTQNEVIKTAFINKAFPDKYNELNLSERIINTDSLMAIPVTDNDIEAAKDEGGAKTRKSWLDRQLDKFGIILTDDYNASLTEAEYAAKLKEYFEKNHVAGRLVAKWFGGPDTIPTEPLQINPSLIEDRGINTLSTDEIERAKSLIGGKEKLVAAAEYDLMSKTFVTASRYTFLSVEQMRHRLEQALTRVDSLLSIVKNPLSKITALALKTSLASRIAGINGFHMAANTYLFHLDLDKNKIDELITKYANDIRGLYTDNSIKLKYVGKADFRDPLLDIKGEWLKVGSNEIRGEDWLDEATIRATDGTVANLQEDYPPFRTLATLHQNGKELYAYIGTKEGCEEGDEFEVLQKTIDESGREVFKPIKTVEIKKGQLWDNRAGAQKTLQNNNKKKDKDDGNPALKYSGFGSSSKLLEGSLLRFLKH